MTTNINAAASAASDFDSKPAWIRKTILSIREVGTSLKQPSSSANSNNSSFTASFSVGSNRSAPNGSVLLPVEVISNNLSILDNK